MKIEKTINEGKMVNKQEVIVAIQEKHQETIEKLNRLWEQYNKEFNENPRKCNKEEYVQKSEYLLGYCSGLMEVCRILVQAAPAPTHEDSAGYYIRQIW